MCPLIQGPPNRRVVVCCFCLLNAAARGSPVSGHPDAGQDSASKRQTAKIAGCLKKTLPDLSRRVSQIAYEAQHPLMRVVLRGGVQYGPGAQHDMQWMGGGTKNKRQRPPPFLSPQVPREEGGRRGGPPPFFARFVYFVRQSPPSRATRGEKNERGGRRCWSESSKGAHQGRTRGVTRGQHRVLGIVGREDRYHTDLNSP